MISKMNHRDVMALQQKELEKICNSNGVSFQSMLVLLDSTKTKKLFKRNNYHQQKINDEIEKI